MCRRRIRRERRRRIRRALFQRNRFATAPSFAGGLRAAGMRAAKALPMLQKSPRRLAAGFPPSPHRSAKRKGFQAPGSSRKPEARQKRGSSRRPRPRRARLGRRRLSLGPHPPPPVRPAPVVLRVLRPKCSCGESNRVAAPMAFLLHSRRRLVHRFARRSACPHFCFRECPTPSYGPRLLP